VCRLRNNRETIQRGASGTPKGNDFHLADETR